MGEFTDLAGQRFGKLTVIRREENGPSHMTRWLCRCDCGGVKIIGGKHLKSGAIKDCGCEKSKKISERNMKHGGCGTRLYRIWTNMIDRTENPKNHCFNIYGGKGIKICEEWRHDFSKFRDWANKNGYQDDLSIDRIDGNKGYYPDNCRWATPTEQANNVNRNHIIQYSGKKMTMAEAAKAAGLSYSCFKERIKLGSPSEKAMTTPSEGRK